MNNPWKSRSQINPQREEGNRQISNEVYRALIKAPLTIGEMKIALCIIDKTWGFNKASDIISVGQMSTATNLGDRGIRKILISLKEKRIIHYQESNKRLNRGSPINEFLFNKHHDTWVFKGGTVVHGLNSGSVKPEQPFRESLNGGSSTKETLTKESIKEIDPIGEKLKKGKKKEEKPLAEFEDFYKTYPKKKSKGQAEKTWNKISPTNDLLKEILKGLELAKKSEDWTKENGKYIPYPSTWLNAKGWEDEITESKDYEIIIDGVSTPMTETEYKQWKVDNGR